MKKIVLLISIAGYLYASEQPLKKIKTKSIESEEPEKISIADNAFKPILTALENMDLQAFFEILQKLEPKYVKTLDNYFKNEGDNFGHLHKLFFSKSLASFDKWFDAFIEPFEENQLFLEGLQDNPVVQQVKLLREKFIEELKIDIKDQLLHLLMPAFGQFAQLTTHQRVENIRTM